jgi:hypothetical protein
VPQTSIADARSQNEAQASPGSLEYRSKLPAQEGEAYVRLYPTAGECAITVVPWYLQARGKPKAAPRAPSSSRQRTVNARRAAGNVRRFIRANGLEYMWTATYRDAPASRATVVEHVRRFLERLQRAFGRMPVVVVAERGGKSGRLHIHFAVERWLPHGRMAELWGHGYVFVGDPGKMSARTSARKLAGYLSKYLTKDLDLDSSLGIAPERGAAHRYQVTEGWQPECRRAQTWDLPRALEYVAWLYGEADTLVEWSDPHLDGVYGVWLSYPDAVVGKWRPAPTGPPL